MALHVRPRDFPSVFRDWASLGRVSRGWRLDDPLVRRRALAAGLAAVTTITAVVLWAGPTAGGNDGPAEAAPAVAVDPDLARVATARLPLVDVYGSPTGGAVAMTLEHPTASGDPLVFLVQAEWEGWYKVRVPAPPAGTLGWVRAADVDVAEHRVRVTIDLDDHLLVAYEEGRIALRAPVAVGLHDRPEPGLTYVTRRVTLGRDHAGYGELALPLAGYENGEDALFRGGGLVAVHGVEDAVDVGQTVSAGSVGLATDDMRALFDLVPVGTPIQVLAEDPRA